MDEWAVFTEKEWDERLEAKMRALTEEIDEFITADKAQREHSLMRAYLYRARYALVEGVAWYDFFRQKNEWEYPHMPRKVTPKAGI